MSAQLDGYPAGGWFEMQNALRLLQRMAEKPMTERGRGCARQAHALPGSGSVYGLGLWVKLAAVDGLVGMPCVFRARGGRRLRIVYYSGLEVKRSRRQLVCGMARIDDVNAIGLSEQSFSMA